MRVAKSTSKTVTDEPIDYIVAPSEPPALKAALGGEVMQLPERYGCDVIWRAHGEWWGVQRKEVKDFLASMFDGRLAKEVGQMRGRITCPMLIMEGRLTYSNDGTLMNNSYGRKVTRQAIEGMVFSLHYEGVAVMHSDGVAGTAATIDNYARWSQKDSHTSLRRRPGPEVASMWGGATNQDWARHLLMGFEGIGPEVADAILKHFGGLPLAFMCTEKDLLSVPGIGPKRAKSMIDALRQVQ